MTSSPPKPQFQIAVGIVERNGRVLISLRKADAHSGDLWEFPGGKVHEGESPEQAVVRELREELGIGVRVERFYARVEHEYPDRRVELLAYLCVLEEGKPTPIHCAACDWVTLSDLARYSFPAANESLIKRLTEQGTR
jgi:mutator protein MutT